MKVLLVFIALAVVAAVGAAVYYVVNGTSNRSYGTALAVLNASADRPLYHSAELMNMTFVVYSNESRLNVTVITRGLNGKMNERRFFNLSEGVNTLTVLYRLPKCNVCGGIRAGSYNITCEVQQEAFFMNTSVAVEIKQ